jgi:hypothetical protein
VFDAESLAFIRTLTETIVKIAIETSDIIAIPIARASLSKSPSTSISTLPASPSHQYIDVHACLTLLQTVCSANASFSEKEGIEQFWRHMKFDFVLLMLMKAQPLTQIMLMLELLRNSALDGTFGAIVAAFGESPGATERQRKHESDCIERLVLLLFEMPTSASVPRSEGTLDKLEENKNEVTVEDVLQLRIQVLTVLEAMCLTTHSTLALQIHRHALPRLFKFLHSTLSSLYALPSPTPASHKLLILSINMSMRIIHHIITFQPQSTSPTHNDNNSAKANTPTIDVRAKLQSILGGGHMHLIALTRLGFSERIAFEEGLWESTVENAHQLLDEFLSPEEGEELLGCFSSGGSEG